MDERPLWYRLLSVFSTMVWLTAAWVLTSLPVVTAPISVVALHDGARQLIEGDAPTWRRFRDVAIARWKVATAFGVALAVPWGGIAVMLVLAAEGNQPIVAGMVTALALLTGAVSAATWYIIAITDGGGLVCLRRIVLAIVFRPLSVLAMSLPWWIAVILVQVTHVRIAVMVVLVAGPACASATCVIARLHSRDATANATPRQRVARRVLSTDAGSWAA